MSKWAHIENIVIIIVIGVTVYFTKTWWGLFLLICLNSSSKEPIVNVKVTKSSQNKSESEK